MEWNVNDWKETGRKAGIYIWNENPVDEGSAVLLRVRKRGDSRNHEGYPE